MTYKAPKAIAVEEIEMTKLTLRHIFCTQSYLRWAKATALTRVITASIHEKGIANRPGAKIHVMTPLPTSSKTREVLHLERRQYCM
jgi:hypothetical protein